MVVAYSTAPREFGPAEVELVELLAQHATLALETAELRAAQERTIAELSAKREVLEWAEAQHRRLMQLLLNEAGLQPLAELLAEALNASITIEDVDDTALAVAPAEPHTPAPDAATRKRRPVRPALESLRARYEVVPIRRCGPDGLPAWVAPVVIGGQLVGRRWGTGAAAVPDPAQRRMIERFALVVAVELLKQRDRVDTENRLAGDLVDELLRTEANLFSGTVLERAAALGHDLSGPQVLAVVAAARAERATRASSPTPCAPPRRPGAAAGRRARRPAGADPARRVRPDADLGPGARAGGRPGGRPAGGDRAGSSGVRSRVRRRVLGRGRGRRALPGRAAPTGVLDLRRLGLAAYLLRTGTTAALRSFADTLVRPLEEYDARKKAQLCRPCAPGSTSARPCPPPRRR